MANVTPQPTPPAGPKRELNVEALVPYRKHISGGLLVIALAGCAEAGYLLYRGGANATANPLFLYSAVLALACLVLALVGLSLKGQQKISEAQMLRLLLLSAGAVIGLCTALLGFALPFTTYRETWAGGLDAWRAKPTALIWPSLALIGGLLLMFASLQLGRGMEREHANIRRLIYGYNAVLMCVLLLAVLAIPNVLAYAEPFTRFFGRSFDWTETDVNTISPALRNVLAELKEPVKVYVIMGRGTAIAVDTETLLENCRNLSNNFTWEFVSVTSPANLTRIRGFMEKYALSDPQGMLVIRGTEAEGAKSDHVFVKMRDLFSQDSSSMRGGPVSYSFLGENALYNALVELLEGKLVVYFTQGHGEMTLEGNQPPAVPGMRPPRGGGELSVLKNKLTERKSVQVKPLKVDRSLKSVPDDASVVVVARPREAFTPGEAKVLRDYVKRSAKTRKTKGKDDREREEEEVTAGRLMLLFNPVIQKQGDVAAMAPTGLEGLLTEFNVKLGNDRVLTVRPPNPLALVAVTSPTSQNPIAKAFNSPDQQTIFQFHNVRTVEPLGEKPGGMTADRLLLVPPQYGFWAESRLGQDPSVLAAALRDDEERMNKLFTGKPLCIAVAVSETSGGAPRDMAHAGVNKETPRMVVFGAADWINDESLSSRAASRMDLFNSCVSWLREKSSIGQVIEAKKRKEYELNIPPQETTRLYFLPPALMILGIIGLGTGVWVVRRR
jgi:hypothetical protein